MFLNQSNNPFKKRFDCDHSLKYDKLGDFPYVWYDCMQFKWTMLS